MAQVNLAWDPNPAEELVTGYRIYVDGAQVAETTGPAYQGDLAAGAHILEVSALNVWGEGPKSDPVTTPPAATKPGHVVISITLNVTVNP